MVCLYQVTLCITSLSKAEHVGDVAAVLARLVGDALRIAEQIEDCCEVAAVA